MLGALQNNTPTDEDFIAKSSPNESNLDTPGFPTASFKEDGDLTGSQVSKENLLKVKRLVEAEVQCLLLEDPPAVPEKAQLQSVEIQTDPVQSIQIRQFKCKEFLNHDAIDKQYFADVYMEIRSTEIEKEVIRRQSQSMIEP